MFGFHGIGLPVPVFNVGGIQYLLRDEFTTDSAAGAVNGTAAEPGPGVRTVVDTESKLSISSGKLSFAGGLASPSVSDPRIYYPAINRAPGLILVTQYTSVTAGRYMTGAGFDNDTSGSLLYAIARTYDAGSFNVGNGPPVILAWQSGSYKFAVLLRSVGSVLLIDSGSGWRLAYIETLSSVATLYPTIGNYNDIFTCDYIRIPTTLWLPTPLASDGFASAFGTTDGLGHQEGVAGGVGAGGSGLNWTQQAGTWTVASNRASASALSGGIAIATVPTSTADVIADVKVTRSAGQGGQVLRYADANNYLFTGHDGTNAVLKQRLAGVESTLITAAAAYSANAVLRCDLSGVNGRLYWNNALVGSTASINAGLTATAHGLYVTDVTANLTVDDFVVYAKGTAGEYAALDAF